MDSKQVLLVEDDEFMRQSVPAYLAAEGFQVQLADNVAGALSAIQHHLPDAVVIDLVIPPDSAAGVNARHARHGLQLIRRVKEQNPALGVVVFSAHEDHGREILELVGQGVRGLAYILKGQPASDLLQALQNVMAGEVHFAPEVRINAWTPAEAFVELCLLPEERTWVMPRLARFTSLTPREAEIVKLLAASRTTPAVAHTLKIEVKTVEAHIHNIYTKLGLNELDSQAPQLNARSILVKIYNIYTLQKNQSRN